MTEELIFGVIFLIVMLWFTVILPYSMAQDRGRSTFFWVIVSIICSPLVAIGLLLMVGKKA